MRVPVHSKDLIRNSSLKKLAKNLQKQWCGPSPLTHTSALELLAQGLGYKDYKDLAVSTSEQMPAGAFSSQSAVRQALMLSIKAAMTPSEWFASDQAALARMIDSLHLNALSAFKMPKKVHQPPRHGEQSTGSNMSALRTQMAKSAWKLSSPQLSDEELESLSRAVETTESLRDQALMSCMMAGLRKGEYLSARPSDFSEDDERTLFVSRGPKKARVTLPPKYWTPISRFITTANLAGNALLFQSKRSPENPMSPSALQKLCEAWAHKAGIDPAKVSPLTIRMSLKLNAAMQMVTVSSPLPIVAKQMGHWPMESMTKYYLSSGLDSKLSD
jgi:integrase